MNLLFELLPAAAAILGVNAFIWACLLLAAKTDETFDLGGSDADAK